MRHALSLECLGINVGLRAAGGDSYLYAISIVLIIAAYAPLLVVQATGLWAVPSYRCFPLVLAGSLALIVYQVSERRSDSSPWNQPLVFLSLAFLASGIALDAAWFASAQRVRFSRRMHPSSRRMAAVENRSYTVAVVGVARAIAVWSRRASLAAAYRLDLRDVCGRARRRWYFARGNTIANPHAERSIRHRRLFADLSYRSRCSRRFVLLVATTQLDSYGRRPDMDGHARSCRRDCSPCDSGDLNVTRRHRRAVVRRQRGSVASDGRRCPVAGMESRRIDCVPVGNDASSKKKADR